MKKKNFILILTFGLILFSHLNAQLKSTQAVNLNIYLDTTYQVIEGFGTFNSIEAWKGQSRAYIYDKYANDLGSSIMRFELSPEFQKTEGGAINIDGGVFMGPTMRQNWEDAKSLYALGVKKFIATVWSPPAFMKYTEATFCPDQLWCRLSNGIGPRSNFVDGLIGEVGAKKNMYPVYAQYVARYCTEFKKYTGFELYGLGLQNEPQFPEVYNSAILEGPQFRDLVNVVGAEFKKQGIKTKIYGSEHMGSMGMESQYITPMLEDTGHNCREYLGFFAVHGYLDGVAADNGSASGWSAMYDAVNKYSKQLWMTETSGYNGQNWSAGGIGLAKSIYLALKFGKISGWVWWSLADDYTPSEYTLVDLGVPDYTYYVSKQYYKYLRPGAVQVKTVSDDVEVLPLAFMHGSEGRLTVIMVNNGTANKTLGINLSGIPAQMNAMRTSNGENAVNLGMVNTNNITLKGSSITTLYYVSSNIAPTINQPADIVLIQNSGVQKVSLTGISDGNNGTQTLTVTASSSNSTIVNNPTVSKVNNATYDLNFTPTAGQSGESYITVRVTDNGSNDLFNSSFVRIKVKVIPFINAAPRLDPIPDQIAGMNKSSIKHNINITNINDGNDGTQKITGYISSSNTSVIRSLKFTYTSGNTGTISYYPLAKGVVTITLRLVDDGGTDLKGVDTKIVTFKITVVDVETGETGFEINDFDCYPNPAKDILNFKVPQSSYNKYRIIDMMGKIIIEGVIASEIESADISQYSKGIYFIELMGENIIARSKFIKE